MGKEDVTILDGTNYQHWRYDIEHTLRSAGLWSLITGDRKPKDAKKPEVKKTEAEVVDENKAETETQQEDESEDDEEDDDSDSDDDEFLSSTTDEQYLKDVSHALHIMIHSLDSSHIKCILNVHNPAIAFTRITSMYESTSVQNKASLSAAYHAITFTGSIRTYFAEIRSSVEMLKAVKVSLPTQQILGKIVNDLPSQFDTFKMTYRMLSSTKSFRLSLTEAQAQLLEIEKSIASSNVNNNKNAISTSHAALSLGKNFPQKQVNNNNKKNFNSKSNNQKKKKFCRYCKRDNHNIEDCFALKKKKEREQASNNNNNQSQPSTSSQSNVSFLVSNSFRESSDWFADTGASGHITNDFSLFSTFTKSNSSDYFQAAKEKLSVLGRGTIKCQFYTGSQWIDGEMKNVSYIPESKFNLFSLGCIPDDYRILIQGSKLTVFKGDSPILCGHKNLNNIRNLWTISIRFNTNQNVSLALVDSLPLQHERFAHFDSSRISRMAKNGTVVGIPPNLKGNISFCKPCVQGKSTDISHYPSINRDHLSPGEFVHLDICGYTNPSIHGHRYFLIVKDQLTSYRKVYFMKLKSEVLSKVKLYSNELKLETGNQLRKIRSDLGSEFTSDAFKSYVSENAIVLETAVAATPQQNGCAERENRTLVEHATSLLCSAKLNQNLWDEAINTIAYIMNRITTGNNTKTPFEQWFGYKPNVSHLRIFGSEGQALDNNDHSKFTSKTRKVIMLGYTSDHIYRVLDVESGYVKKVSSVKFDEKLHCRIDNQSNSLSSDSEDNSESESDHPTVEPHLTEQVDSQPKIRKTRKRIVYQPNPERISSLRSAISNSQQTAITNDAHTALAFPDQWLNVALILPTGSEPQTYEEALCSEDKRLWHKAMEEEMSSIHENKTWILVDCPRNVTPIGVKWIFRIKQAENKVRYKARLVAQGFAQRPGLDFLDTYAPVVQTSSVLALLSIAASLNLEMIQFDVSTAFLNGYLNEEIYTRQPPGFDDESGRVCLLKRGLYGLRQSPRAWNSTFNDFLITYGLIRSEYDTCVYFRVSSKSIVYLALYVDDGIILSNHKSDLESLIQALKTKFKITFGPVSTYVGLEIQRIPSEHKIQVTQTNYIKKMLIQFGMSEAKAINCPLDHNVDLVPNDDSPPANFPYRQVIGCLVYLSSHTRPDLAYSVSVLARFCQNPSHAHVNAVKRVLRYLIGTQTRGINLGSTSPNLSLSAYSDSDWAGDLITRRSTTGILVSFGGPIAWQSRQQSTVALSTCEAEYIALSECSRIVLYLRNLLTEIQALNSNSPVSIFCDNQTAVGQVNQDTISPRIRHIDIKYHFVRKLTNNKQISVKWIPAEQQRADGLTKALPNYKFVAFLNLLDSM